MVFDPLSIIGYVGTTAGLTGFLVSTITRLEQFGRDFGEAPARLQWYNLQVSTANSDLKAWSRLWCEEFQYTDEDYEYLWGTGPGGYSHIQALLETVRHELDAIGILMYGSLADGDLRNYPQVMRHTWEGWQQELDGMSQVRNGYDPGDNWFRNFFNKLRFASYRGANLEERTKRLRDKIKDLTTDSQKLFIQTQFWLAGSQNADGDAIRQLNQRRERMDDRYEQLRQFHSLSCTLGEWSLVLTLPDEGSGPILIDEESSFSVKFDHQPLAVTRRDAANLGIFITFSPPIGEASGFRPWYDNQVETAAQVLQRSKSLHDLFPTIQARKPGRRRSLAYAAIGIVNWTMLLWDMPWTVGICSCRLRFVAMLSTDGSADSRASITTSAEPCPKNHTHHISERPALLMGISLAELALKQPITATVNANGNKETTFHINRSSQPTDEEGLLGLVKRRSTLGYRDAVMYCFVYDRALSRRNHQFRPHDVATIKERVLDPLVNYLNGSEPESTRPLHAAQPAGSALRSLEP